MSLTSTEGGSWRLMETEIFCTVKEAKHLIMTWRWEYNHVRPHSSLGYRPPAPAAWIDAQAPNYVMGLT